jgi:hypothetical protein
MSPAKNYADVAREVRSVFLRRDVLVDEFVKGAFAAVVQVALEAGWARGEIRTHLETALTRCEEPR